MFRATASVLLFTLAVAFPQVASNTAALRAVRIVPGLPMPPTATNTHWASPVNVEDVWTTQQVALVVVTIVMSNEMAYVNVHKGGSWKKKYFPVDPPVITSITTNVFSITNAPELK